MYALSFPHTIIPTFLDVFTLCASFVVQKHTIEKLFFQVLENQLAGSAHVWKYVRRLFFGSAQCLNLALFLPVDHVATYVRGRSRFGDSVGASFVEFHEAVFEFSVLFYLIRINAHHGADL